VRFDKGGSNLQTILYLFIIARAVDELPGQRAGIRGLIVEYDDCRSDDSGTA
jgi:hypothetical protein